MNKKSYLLYIISTLFIGILFQFSTADSYAQGRNSISGFVSGDNGRGVTDVYVELQDEYYSTVRRERTNGSGSYNFRSIPDGRYYVKVLAGSTNYDDQIRAVSLIPVSAVRGSGAVNEQVDFTLNVKRSAYGPFVGPPGIVFVQEVPQNAEEYYEKGISFLSDDKDNEGFDNLKKAIEIFPEYYNALDRLGTEYVKRGYYEPAYIILSVAKKVNPNSYSSTFGFGIAQFKLNQVRESITTFEKAIQLYNKSIDANLWLGIALIQNDNLTEAEKYLLQSNKLGKNKVPDVYWQLARLYGKQKQYGKSADALEFYLKYKNNMQNKNEIKATIANLRKKQETEQ